VDLGQPLIDFDFATQLSNLPLSVEAPVLRVREFSDTITWRNELDEPGVAPSQTIAL